MNRDYVFKFFNDFQVIRNDLEKYIQEDNKLRIDTMILKMHKLLDKLKKNLDNSFRLSFSGEL